MNELMKTSINSMNYFFLKEVFAENNFMKEASREIEERHSGEKGYNAYLGMLCELDLFLREIVKNWDKEVEDIVFSEMDEGGYLEDLSIEDAREKLEEAVEYILQCEFDELIEKYMGVVKRVKALEQEKIFVSKNIKKDAPILIVDFDDVNLADPEDMAKAKGIVSNIKNLNPNKVFYTLSNDCVISDLSNCVKLGDWTENDGAEFINDLSSYSLDGMELQICGMYRELCIVEVANMIKRSNLNIEPIIIDNDDYSISATYSVQEGDTLENRLAECNCYIENI